MRYLVISDIHGRIDVLKKLLTKVQYQKNKDLKLLDKVIISNLESLKEIIKYKNHNFLYKIKNIIISKIDSIPNNGYIKSLILGDNNSVDKDSLNSYRQNGVSHLFAISGMHVIFIIKILELFN